MKRYFMIGLGMVLILSLSLIAYGAWLNERGEVQITERMEERRLDLIGAKATVREIHPIVRFSVINLYSPNVADAVALTAGRIVSSLTARNSYVHKGDILFVLENEDIALSLQKAEAGILSANAELNRAENNYDRYSRLREKKATSVQQFEEVESAYVAAKANLQAAIAERDKLLMEDSRREVIAPIDGTVRIIYRQTGTYVQDGTPLALIGDYRELYFSDTVKSNMARLLHVGQEAECIFPAKEFRNLTGYASTAEDSEHERSFRTVLEDISPPLTEAAETRTLLWKIDNALGLLNPQTYGAVSLRLTGGHSSLSIPLSAMVDGGNSTVFVVRDGIIERRAVKTGTNDGIYIEILSGLKEGDVVVTSGAEGLADGMKVNITLDDRIEGGTENGKR